MGSGTGSFSAIISGLKAQTKYYVRAYATSPAGTAYGNQVSFQTSPVDTVTNIFIGGGNNLYALSGDSAKLKWMKTLGGSVRSSPFYRNGIVYVGCDDGNLYAFDINGNPKWTANTGMRVGASSPVVSKGVVFVCNRLSVFAFNATTGALKWKFDHNNNGASGVVVANNKVYVNAGYSYALDEETGTVVWSEWMNQQDVLPKVSGNRFYALYGSNYVLRVLDANTGQQVGTTDLNVSQPVCVNVVNGTIYACQESILYAIDSATLGVKWGRSLSGGMYSSSLQGGSAPVVVDSIVHVVTSTDGNIEQYNTRDGSYVNTYGTNLYDNNITVVNNFSYFGSRDIYNNNNGLVYGVELSFQGIGWAGPIKSDFSTTACFVTKSGKMYRAGDVYLP